jgi:hypothetical protein
MATRMQQRRGTAAQWTAANPTLAAGEIGFETDTNKFKVGNGSSAWTSLAYFVDASIVFDSSEVQGLVDAAVADLVGAAPNALNSIWELANSLNGDANYAYNVTQNLINLGNSIALNTNSISELTSNAIYLTGNVSAHTSANTSVHGISNTLNLVYNDNAALTNERTPVDGSVTEAKIASSAVTSGKIAADAIDGSKIADNAISSEHIANEAISDAEISNTAAIAQSKISGLTTDLSTITTNITYKQDKVTDVSDTEIGYLANVTSDIQSQINGKASLSGATFTGSVEIDQNLTVDGNFIVNGSNVLVSATQIQIEDTLLQLGHTNAANTTDLGLITSYNDGTQKHSGLVKDVTDGKWKLFDGVTTEPATTVDFTEGTLDTLALKFLEANTVTVSAGVAFPDGTQTKEGVPSRTPIISKTASYTLTATSERDSLIEVNSSSGTTITIPLNSAVAFPVGTTLDILQTGAGQVTIAGDSGVTVNSTPGLKLRTQWSSCTLFKRATDSWVVFGDLSA